MLVMGSKTTKDMDAAAVDRMVAGLADAIEARGSAVLVLSVDAELEWLLDELVGRELDWSKVEVWHVAEFVGTRIGYAGSRRAVLKERVSDRLPLKFVHYINGDAYDPQAECARLGGLLRQRTVDVALVSLGVDGRLIFQGPGVDLEADQPFQVVTLDEVSRKQQVSAGVFASLDDVPTQAVCLGLSELFRARKVVCVAAGEALAKSVKAVVEGPVSPAVPASALQKHADVAIFLDAAAAAKLKT